MKVIEYDSEFDGSTTTTTEGPAAGATVTAGDRTFTAGPDGVASVTVGSRSLAGVRATKDGFIRSATQLVCVDCADGPAAAGGGGVTAPGHRRAGRDRGLRARRRRVLAAAGAAAAAGDA